MSKAKILILVLVVTLLVSGCASTPTTTTGTTGGTTTKATTTVATTSATTTAEPLYFNETGMPIVDEPITLKIAGRFTSFQTTWKDNLQLEYLTEMTGIKFDGDGLSTEGWQEQKSLMFASDSLPDLFIASDFSAYELLEYGSEGQLVALNDLVDSYGPAIQNAFAEFPVAKAMSTSGDGSMYTLPLINPVIRDMHNRYWLNKVWVDRLGKQVPTTLDELYDVLKAFKDEDANGNGDPSDEIPLSGTSGGGEYSGLILNALGVNVRNGEYNITATEDGTVYCANISDAYKEYLKYMNRLYSEQILDNDLFVQNNDQLVAKAQQNIIGGANVAAMYITAGVDIGYDYIQIDALTSALSNKKMVSASTGVSVGHTAITNVNEYPEATIRLLDYFYTEEGGRMAYVGVEDVGWYWIDKAKGVWDKMQPEGYNNAEEFRNSKSTIQNGGWGAWERAEFNAGQGSENALWLNEMSIRDSFPYFVTQFPKNYLPLNEEDSKTVTTIEADLTNYITQARARFITGEDDVDAKWEEYVTQVKNMGIEQIVSIYQEYYDVFLENMG